MERGKKTNCRKRSAKQRFTSDEDSLITKMLSIYGQDWNKISKYLKGRTPRQVRERWKYYLQSTLLKSKWSSEEDSILVEKYYNIGPRWSIIAQSLEGRTHIDVRNRFRCLNRNGKINGVLFDEPIVTDIDSTPISSENYSDEDSHPITISHHRQIIFLPMCISQLPDI